MKKLISLLLAALLLALPALSLAEGAESAESSDFFDALRSWYYGSGAADFNAGVAQFFRNGAAVARETLQGYLQMAEEYLREIYPQWDEATQQAWQTLTEAARETGSKAREEVEEAWAVIKAWMTKTGEAMSDGLRAIVNAIGSAAGVEEARQELDALMEAGAQPTAAPAQE